MKTNLLKLTFSISFILTLLVSFGSLKASVNKSKMKISITKASGSKSYNNYKDWLLTADPNLEIIDLKDRNLNEIDSLIKLSDGLLLSGGPDIDPVHFGKVAEKDRCTIDLRRDSIEFKAIHSAVENNVPILGICRGLQLLNVAFGGSLYTDIPSDVPNFIPHQQTEGDSYHQITCVKKSLLYNIIGNDTITVNSNHHQSIDKIADNFIVTAETVDSVVEAIEYTGRSPWIFAVQWHPERLDFNSKASGMIAKKFLEEVQKSMFSRRKK